MTTPICIKLPQAFSVLNENWGVYLYWLLLRFVNIHIYIIRNLRTGWKYKLYWFNDAALKFMLIVQFSMQEKISCMIL